MKKTKSFSLAILTILWVTSMCLGQDKAPGKNPGNRAKASAEQQAWQAKLAKMTPEQQEVAKAKKAFETAVAPWRAIRLIAAEENATKTMAAIDKIIATKEKQLTRKLASQQAGKAGPRAGAKKPATNNVTRKAKKKGAAN